MRSLLTGEGLEQLVPDVPSEVPSKKDEHICFLKKQNYKVIALTERVASVIKTLVPVPESGAGSKLRPYVVPVRFGAPLSVR